VSVASCHNGATSVPPEQTTRDVLSEAHVREAGEAARGRIAVSVKAHDSLGLSMGCMNPLSPVQSPIRTVLSEKHSGFPALDLLGTKRVPPGHDVIGQPPELGEMTTPLINDGVDGTGTHGQRVVNLSFLSWKLWSGASPRLPDWKHGETGSNVPLSGHLFPRDWTQALGTHGDAASRRLGRAGLTIIEAASNDLRDWMPTPEYLSMIRLGSDGTCRVRDGEALGRPKKGTD
jgi:hypothetical protein